MEGGNASLFVEGAGRQVTVRDGCVDGAVGPGPQRRIVIGEAGAARVPREQRSVGPDERDHAVGSELYGAVEALQIRLLQRALHQAEKAAGLGGEAGGDGNDDASCPGAGHRFPNEKERPLRVGEHLEDVTF